MENSGGYQRLFEEGNYGTMLRCHTVVSRQLDLDEHPGSTDLSRTIRSEASKVIGSVEQGDGDAQPMMVNSEASMGSATVMK